nr:photosystem II protein T [Ziziphus hajarensis]
MEALVYTFLLVSTLGIIFFRYLFSRTTYSSNYKGE